MDHEILPSIISTRDLRSQMIFESLVSVPLHIDVFIPTRDGSRSGLGDEVVRPK